MTGGLWSVPGSDHRPNRALPAWAIDKLVFGLREDRGSDPRKVWGECVSIAMSAYRRGWTRNEFVDEVTKCEKKKDARGRKRWMEHRLWVQLRSYNSSDKAAFKALDKAWEAAVANLNGVGIRTKEEVHDDAVEWAFLWAERITDGIDGLTDTEAAVLGYVVSETERRGMMQVTCPSRAGEGAISADEVVQASFDQNFAEITRKTDPEKGALLVWILCGVDVGFRTVMSLLRRDGGQVSVPSKVALSNGSWIISLLNKKE